MNYSKILESWVSEAIDAGDFDRARRICDLFVSLWFAERGYRSAA